MNVARAAKPWAAGIRGTRRSLGRRRPGNGLASSRAIISSVTSKAPGSSPAPCSPAPCSPARVRPPRVRPPVFARTGAWRTPGLGDNLGHRFRDGNRVGSPHGDRANAQHDRGSDETDREPGQRCPACPQVAQPDREPGEGDAGVTEDHDGRHAHAGGPLGAQAATRHPGTQHVRADAGSEQPCDQRRDGERATRKPRWARRARPGDRQRASAHAHIRDVPALSSAFPLRVLGAYLPGSSGGSRLSAPFPCRR